MTAADGFGFSQVVGLDDAKLALKLVAVDPLIGGVLLRGEKGSAKTTLARGLAALLGPDAAFVDLPLSATEDRLVGTLDLASALAGDAPTFSPGLLAQAHNGVLYVDEVNLLADHLVDTLLDVAASGVNRVEREAISHEHPARFVLIGSMNPEEGELRPQLLDRFGLSVGVAASPDVQLRSEAVRRRLRFDGADIAGVDVDDGGLDAALRREVSKAIPAHLPNDVVELASALALAVGAQGLRADLVLCRAAAANAGLAGRTVATVEDLHRVAPLALAHRSRHDPFDPAVVPPEQLDDAIDSVLGPSQQPAADGAPVDEPPPSAGDPRRGHRPSSQDHLDTHPDGRPQNGNGDAGPMSPMASGDERVVHSLVGANHLMADRGRPAAQGSKRGRVVESDRGRLVRDLPFDVESSRPVAVAATVRHLAARRRTDAGAELDVGDLREVMRRQRAGRLLILVVDTSGSMGATARAEAATGTALGLLTDAYQRRDQVALVTFGRGGATTVLGPTGSIEVARNRLHRLETGGPTPLALGIDEGLSVAAGRRDQSREPFMILLTDGRATATATATAIESEVDVGSALDAALAAGLRVAAAGIAALVLDCETGTPRLGLATRVAEAMGAQCVPAGDLDPRILSALIQSSADQSPSLIR